MTRHYLDILADVIRENLDKPALTDYATLDGGPGNSYTYGQMYEQILALCDRFRQLGLKPGDHIAICGENSVNWLVAYLAIAYYGGVCVTILPNQDKADIKYQISFSDAVLTLMDQEIFHDSPMTVMSSKWVMFIDDFSIFSDVVNFKPFDQWGDWKNIINREHWDMDHVSHICFTSGTSSTAKAVMLSSRNISAVVCYDRMVYDCHHRKMLPYFPFAHITAILEAIIALSMESEVVCYQDSVTAHNLLTAWERIVPFETCLVPIIASSLLSERNVDRFRAATKHMTSITITGAISDQNLERKMKEYGMPIMNVYGMSESPVTGIISPSEYRAGSSGRIVPTLEGRISENGEILVRGENVMLGYYKDPEATAAKIDKDGWLHTGDRGHLDEDGYLYVEGRLEQDMIVLPSGENISPAKVEAIINACDGVEESIVIARDGKLLALVVPTTTTTMTRNELLAQINPQLPAYSQLFGLEFLSAPLARTEKKTIKRYLYN